MSPKFLPARETTQKIVISKGNAINAEAAMEFTLLTYVATDSFDGDLTNIVAVTGVVCGGRHLYDSTSAMAAYVAKQYHLTASCSFSRTMWTRAPRRGHNSPSRFVCGIGPATLMRWTLL
jgi:hypothetical protein